MDLPGQDIASNEKVSTIDIKPILYGRLGYLDRQANKAAIRTSAELSLSGGHPLSYLDYLGYTHILRLD